MVNQSSSQSLLSYRGSTKINSPLVAISYANKRMVTGSTPNSVNPNTPKNIFKNSGTAFSLLYTADTVAYNTVDGQQVYGAYANFGFSTGTSNSSKFNTGNNGWTNIWNNTAFSNVKTYGCWEGAKIRPAVLNNCGTGNLYAVPLGGFNDGNCNSNPWISGGFLVNYNQSSSPGGGFRTGWGGNYYSDTWDPGYGETTGPTVAVLFNSLNNAVFEGKYQIPNNAAKYRLKVYPS